MALDGDLDYTSRCSLEGRARRADAVEAEEVGEVGRGGRAVGRKVPARDPRQGLLPAQGALLVATEPVLHASKRDLLALRSGVDDAAEVGEVLHVLPPLGMRDLLQFGNDRV